MKKYLAVFSLTALVIGGWYLASPYWSLMKLGEAVRDRNVAELQERVDYPALRASAAEQFGRIARERIEEGNLLEQLGRAAASALDRNGDDFTLSPEVMVDTLLTDDLARNLVPPDIQGPPLGFDIERQGFDRFVALGIHDDGTRGPDLIFERDGLGWDLVGFELP
ncbi:DUF2939 domain-containing protein [Aurantiacibacter sp. MUD11]|uniref:DUF2939 domain-containing protein n=1 Tax=Aurantiacibacter sp. MUD11 TaxID=3003265 RepID=UPI0022AAD885|nr:DUF2939 domain-containing protein [Aurantiacibacter sp. MUD11]WAT18740.1 DUF2939 domain-containing protein [Aurantiacibacter sp. MUD11]